MLKGKNIPRPTIERLPLYLSTLRMLQDSGIEVVSSKRLGKEMGLKAVQIRKDLAFFGEFGQRGVGYDVGSLIQHINRILGVGPLQKIALVGAGRIGTALASYKGFMNNNFRIAAIFDTSADIVGTVVSDVIVKHVEELEATVRSEDIRIGIIAVPDIYAQDIANHLVSAGVKAVWNFAPASIHVPEGVHVYQQNLSVGLLTLSYYLAHKCEQVVE